MTFQTGTETSGVVSVLNTHTTATFSLLKTQAVYFSEINENIVNNEDMEKLQKDLDRLWEWAVENVMEINRSKSKAVRFTRARVNDPLNYSLIDALIPEANRCKYIGKLLCRDLCWDDQLNCTVKNAWKALQFTIRLLIKGNSNTKSLVYMSLVRPILEYGAA